MRERLEAAQCDTLKGVVKRTFGSSYEGIYAAGGGGGAHPGSGGSEGGSGEESQQESEQGVAVEDDVIDNAEPGKFAVVLHNDNYTTMEFVVEVLKKYFQKSGEESIKVMLQIHNQGKGVAGVYSFQIAETKVMQVTEYARANGHPLKCTMEEIT